jgi:hypothetical protein
VGKLQIHYNPCLAETHTLNIVDLRTCEADGEEWPCTLRQLMNSIDYMNENDLGIDDVTTGRWISGPHKARS